MTDNVYDQARKVLRERGWCKGTNEDETGAVCLAGALNVAETGHAAMGANKSLLSSEHAKALRPFIREQFPEWAESGCVMPFNDHTRTTLADVDLVLDKAARAWDEQVRP